MRVLALPVLPPTAHCALPVLPPTGEPHRAAGCLPGMELLSTAVVEFLLLF